MQHQVPPDQEPIALSAYLPRALDGLPAWAVRQMLQKRQVKREGKRLEAQSLVYPGDRLVFYLPKGAMRAKGPELRRVYEDDFVVIIIKPPGISVKQTDGPGQSVEQLLAAELGLAKVWACHRLDYYTGGLLVLAKDPQSEALLREAFAHRRIEKYYICLVLGIPHPAVAEKVAYLRKDAKDARVEVRERPFSGAVEIRTAYQVLEAGEVSRLRVELLTGRTHQIRAHLAFLGHPILGDDKYGDRAANHRLGVTRQRLWASELCLHPGGHLTALDGRCFTAEPPF